MDGFESVGERSCKQTHETDRHAIDLLALVYQALIDRSIPLDAASGTEHQPRRTPRNECSLQEVKS